MTRQISPRPPSAAEVFDLHSRGLFSLARVVLDDPREAEAVVLHVLREAAPQRRAPDDRGDRRNLARRVYLRATRSRLGPRPLLPDLSARDGGSGPPTRDVGLTGLSDQQRAVIALCLFGGHTHVDAADLLSLPLAVVDELLRSGLNRIGAVAE